MNKASGGDGIPVELFQILKDENVIGMTCKLNGGQCGELMVSEGDSTSKLS